ncbi:putative reverse transcriptase zinc-binding domain-containing protein [Arabidopsis thaliana]
MFDFISYFDKMCSAFLWSGPSLNARKTKVAWSVVCTPKSEGGLGLRAVEETNKVCMLKLIWRILSAKGSLWVDWVKKHLLRGGSLWAVKETSSRGSWIWKKLLKYRDKAKCFHKVDVRNGESTSFWYDSWSSLGCLYDKFGERGCIDMGIPKDSTLSSAIMTTRRRKHRQPLLNAVETEIQKQKQSRIVTERDVALWKGKEDGFHPTFLSKETWSQIRNTQPEMQGYRGIWFSNATPKFALLTWLMVRNRIATGEKMGLWNQNTDTSCIFCKNPNETRDHLFFQCVYTRKVWNGLIKGLLLDKYSDRWQDIILMLTRKDFDTTKSFILGYVLQNSIHSIWRERNDRRHGEDPSNEERLIKFIDKNIRNRLSTLRRGDEEKYVNGIQVWFGSRRTF